MNIRYLSDIRVLRLLFNRYNMEPNYVRAPGKTIFKQALGIDKIWFPGGVVANFTYFLVRILVGVERTVKLITGGVENKFSPETSVFLLFPVFLSSSPTDVEETVTKFIASEISFNVYMFHGGTNFGFMNGATDFGIHRGVVTSYGKYLLVRLPRSRSATELYRGGSKSMF